MTTSIVCTICEQHGVTKGAFFGQSKMPELVECRRAAVLALLDAGFSKAGCARMIRRNISTVNYWLNERDRLRRRARCIERMRTKRQAQKAAQA